jgi:hypothetical protein
MEARGKRILYQCSHENRKQSKQTSKIAGGVSKKAFEGMVWLLLATHSKYIETKQDIEQRKIIIDLKCERRHKFKIFVKYKRPRTLGVNNDIASPSPCL